MTDKLVQPLVSFTVETLLKLLGEKAIFLGAVRGQVEEMQKELQSMQTYLIDADRRRGEGDEDVTNAVVEIRELAYDAEDIIASFVVKVAGSSKRKYAVCFDLKRFFCYVNTIGTRHRVGKEMEDINKEIASLTGRLERYKVEPRPVAKKTRKEYPTPVEGIVVGLEDQVRMMVNHLKDKNGQRIVSIYGMGGLGKTTFSKKICYHTEIKHHFDHVAWVCVSQQFDPVQVWRDILLQFDGANQEKEAIRNLTENELVTKLHSTQNDKKCLVVLDDIWEQEDWNSLCHTFPRATTTGSKIVLTTRKRDLVSHAKDITSFLYELPFLEDKLCQELLETKLSPETQEMKNVIKEIAGRCGGLPLAVVLVGGLLAEDTSIDAWDKVRRDLSNSFNQGSDRERGVQQVLGLSYQDLPHHLKACFLYLSLFPEDCDIEAKSLVQMWVAEGFVTAPATVGEGTEKTTLDVGLSYLNELVNRCLVHADIKRFNRRVRSIRLHDLMREFCLSKAREENFSRDLYLQSSSSSSYAIRRLAVGWKDEQVVTTIPDGQQKYKHVRSCIVHGDESKYWDKTNSLLKGFEFLKVLNLIGTLRLADEGQLSEDIGKLKHLRFIRFPQAGGLPSSLGDLILLQTLDLRSVACTVPDVFVRMTELRHLYLPIISDLSTKLNLGGLSKLETLVNVESSSCDIGSLCELRNIRKLVIEFDVNELATILEFPMFKESNTLMRCSTFSILGHADTQEKHDLLSRVLAHPRVTKLSLCGRLRQEFSFQNFNRKITRISLKGCRLKNDPMPFLGKMPNLRSLELTIDSYFGNKMVCHAPNNTTVEISNNAGGGFPQLTRLSLNSLRITEWEVEEGAMPCLSFLELINCKELMELPDGLKFISTLQKLNLTNVNESLKRKLQGDEDFHKIVCIV